MIIGYSGTPGSGKSYEAMKAIIDNLQRGRKVFTNIDGAELSECREGVRVLCKLEPWDLSTQYIYMTREDVLHIPESKENNCIYVIDEIHEFYGNRDWETQKNKDFLKWAKSHRHRGIDLIMVTTNIEGVDKQVRELCQWTYDFSKIDYFGKMVNNSYDVAVYRGSYLGGKPFDRKHPRRYDPKIFSCYKSYVTDEIKELKLHKPVNILRHPVFYIIPVILLFTLYMASKSSLFGGGMLGGVKNLVNKNKSALSVPVKGKASDLKKPVISSSKVVEYRDLTVEKNNVVAAVAARDVGGRGAAAPGVGQSPASPSCRRSGFIVMGDRQIELNDCGDKTLRRIDGVLVHESKNHSVSRSVSSVAKVEGYALH